MEVTFTTKKKLKLNSIVLVYNDGASYKCMDIKILFDYNIIYDKFYEGSEYHDISITFCPYSFTARIYFGKFKKSKNIHNGNIVLLDCENTEVSQFLGKPIDEADMTYYRKKDVIITTYRNALTLFPDFLYILPINKSTDTNDNSKQDYLKPKDCDIRHDTSIDYKKVLPDTFIYGVEYLSKKTGKKKYTAVISKYSSPVFEDNFNYRDTGYYMYFTKFLKKIVRRSAIITPCLWYVWVYHYPNTSTVFISQDK